MHMDDFQQKCLTILKLMIQMIPKMIKNKIRILNWQRKLSETVPVVSKIIVKLKP